MTIPILPDVVLAVLAAAVAWLLIRRFDPFALPVLLVLSGTATLVTGALVVITMQVTGLGGGAAPFSQEWPSAAWHVAGLVLLAAGVSWTAWRPPTERSSLSAHMSPPGGPALCSAACVICRDESLAAVCVLETEGTIAEVTAGFAAAVGCEPEDLKGRPIDAVLDLPIDVRREDRESAVGNWESGLGNPQSEIQNLQSETDGNEPRRTRSTDGGFRGPDERRGTDGGTRTPKPTIQDPQSTVSRLPALVRGVLRPVHTRITEARASGGQPVLAAITTHACGLGQVVCITVQDAAPLVLAERRARDAEALQRGIAERAPVAVLTVGRRGAIEQANVEATRLLGLPRSGSGGLVGRSVVAVLEQVAAEGVDAERFLTRAWQDKATSLSLVVRRIGHPPCPVELLARVFWELPEPLLLIFGRSKAYERRLERQLAGIHRLSVLGRLFNGTAHDVNNVLATVLAWAQWLGRQRLPATAQEPLRLIEQAAADGAHIVRRSLELARGRRRPAGGSAPNRVAPGRRATPLDLNTVVADALAMCRSRTSQPDAPIHVERQLAQSALVRGDDRELRELLINLVLNAIEAMPHGGTLRVGTRSDADHVQLLVTDTGHGMDAAVRHRVFEPFFTTRGHQGSGLGLTLVRQIAVRHDATTDVESAPGKGTTIRLTFARAASSDGGSGTSDLPPAMPRRPPGNERTGRVLFVDDQEAIQRVVEDILRHAGHDVRTASSARQALAACSRREFDCLLIDLHLPDVDGWQLAAQARQRDPTVALVCVSGWADPDDAPRGPFDFALPKPFDLDAFLAVVSEAVELCATRRATGAAPVSQPSTSPARLG